MPSSNPELRRQDGWPLSFCWPFSRRDRIIVYNLWPNDLTPVINSFKLLYSLLHLLSYVFFCSASWGNRNSNCNLWISSIQHAKDAKSWEPAYSPISFLSLFLRLLCDLPNWLFQTNISNTSILLKSICLRSIFPTNIIYHSTLHQCSNRLFL